MISALAKKLGIPMVTSDWEIRTLNKAVGLNDSVKRLEAASVADEENIGKLIEKITEQAAFESFLIKATTESKVSSLFRDKLKKLMHDEGLSIDVKDGKIFIKVAKRTT